MSADHNGDVTRHRRRHLRNEAGFRLYTVADVLALHARAMREAGLSRREADTLCMWVVHQQRSGAPVAAKQTRSKYRRVLAELEGRAPNEPGTGRPPELELGAAG